VITIGADPELFFTKRGQFVSAVGIVPGTKEKPFEFAPGYNIHHDNVAVEYNIPPAYNKDQWMESHYRALKYIRDLAKSKHLNLKIVSDAVFSDSELESPEARLFGCNPDFSAWELMQNPVPEASGTNLRTAGGHIHVGGDNWSFAEKIKLVRLLDIFVGIPLSMKEPTSRRNELYGKPGAMRDKPYGFEWRAPSNIWLRKAALMGDVYYMVQKICSEPDEYVNTLDRVEEDIELINKNNASAFIVRQAQGKGIYSEAIHGSML
jgi:hypothetical protein